MVNLFSKMDSSEMYQKFKIILQIQKKTIHTASNDFVRIYVKKYHHLLPKQVKGN